MQEYISDMWNVIDFVTNALYVATVALRIVSYHQVRKHSWYFRLIRFELEGYEVLIFVSKDNVGKKWLASWG